MIQLNFDTSTGVAKLAAPAVIKAGADVRVKVVFSTAPGAETTCQFALGTDADGPGVLAFTDDFASENATTWTALLDANDTRLLGHMAGKGATQVNAELVCVIDGEKQVAPNVPVTVQPAIIAGPEASEGGPDYYTTAEADAAFAAKTVAGKYRIKPDGTFQIWNATQSKFHTLTLSGAAGAEQLEIGAGED